MKIKKYLLLSTLLSLNLYTSQAQISTENKISLPAKQYMLERCENKIFVQTFMKYGDLRGDIVRFEGDANYEKGGRMENYVSFKKPISGDKMEVKLYDGRSFTIKESAVTEIITAKPNVGAERVNIQFLGDSYTRGCYFRSAFIDSGLVPNASLIGTRKVGDCEGQYHEGRGGWKVSTYFSQSPSNKVFHNPYYQPVGKQRYWGSVEFWKQAVAIEKEGSAGLDFNTRYHCGDYDTRRFKADGYLAKPKKGDLMYSIEEKEYMEWNGRKWKKEDEPSSWIFDYSKYLDMWEFEAPEFLVVMLGLNDFRDQTLPLDFKVWNERVTEILTSYRRAVPNGRLLLCTPCTSCGTLNNESGAFTTRQNTTMWYVRENIIRVFDGREKEGIYVVDASATIDNENGYNTKGAYQVGNPHPYPNYPALGVPIAACVQYYRKK